MKKKPKRMNFPPKKRKFIFLIGKKKVEKKKKTASRLCDSFRGLRERRCNAARRKQAGGSRQAEAGRRMNA